MKRQLMLVIGLSMSLMLFGGCGRQAVEESVSRIKTVETLAVVSSSVDETLSYYGHAEYGTLTKLSFKSAGVLESLSVQKGDVVQVGETIAALDSSDYSYQVAAANAGVQSVNATLSKAQKAYADAQADYANYEALYASGNISKTALDKAKLNLDVSEQDVYAAQEGYEQARHNLDALEKAFADLTMTSTVAGIVVETPYEINEAVAAGYPVVIVRSEDTVFKTSVAQKDLSKLSLGQSVRMHFEMGDFSGIITSIGNTPDSETHTYEVEISLDGDVPLGSVGEAVFVVEENTGIFIPLEVVIKGTTDYVYVVEDGKAVKRDITVLKRIDNALLVDGLDVGDALVVKGFTRLNDSDQVNVLEGEAQ